MNSQAYCELVNSEENNETDVIEEGTDTCLWGLKVSTWILRHGHLECIWIEGGRSNSKLLLYWCGVRLGTNSSIISLYVQSVAASMTAAVQISSLDHDTKVGAPVVVANWGHIHWRQWCAMEVDIGTDSREAGVKESTQSIAIG